MLVTCDEMQRAEQAAFANGVTASELMEQAGFGIAEIVRQFHPRPAACVAYCGKGNNAGDALVALRHLREWGWAVSAELSSDPQSFSELPARHYAALRLKAASRSRGQPLVALDGLLGIGARGEPRGRVAESIAALNTLRETLGAWVLAIDIPSGLNGDSGAPSAICVEADCTATIGAVKQGLVAENATQFVGRLAVIPLDRLEPGEGKTSPAQLEVSTPLILRAWLPRRSFDMHKGDCGRIGVIAGSTGFSGAAQMCSAAAVHAGAGLVTLFCRPDVAGILAATAIPEVMVRSVSSLREVADFHLDCLAIGPGLGSEHSSEIVSLIRDAAQPMVVDADALNALASDPSVLKHCRGPRLLTPHPGEMQRIFPKGNLTRRQWLEAFCKQFPVPVLLKGARTLIGCHLGTTYINTTGNPGMASGGMGDVLTGVCAALAAQGSGDPASRLHHAGIMGAWLCGRAAEIAVSNEIDSFESLRATSVIRHLSNAFTSLRRNDY